MGQGYDDVVFKEEGCEGLGWDGGGGGGEGETCYPDLVGY